MDPNRTLFSNINGVRRCILRVAFNNVDNPIQNANFLRSFRGSTPSLGVLIVCLSGLEHVVIVAAFVYEAVVVKICAAIFNKRKSRVQMILGRRCRFT